MTLISHILGDNIDLVAGAIISILFAFFIWLITHSYYKHCEEVALLKKLEILLARNLGAILINQSYFSKWLSAMNQPRLYNCAFRTYIFLEHEDLNITNQDLLNRLVKYDFSLRGFDADLGLLYSVYHDASTMLLSGNHVQEWSQLNENTIEQIEAHKISFAQAAKDSIDLIGFLRAYFEQKKMTPYGLFRRTIGRSLLPAVSRKKIEGYKKIVMGDLIAKQSELDYPDSQTLKFIESLRE